MIQLFIFLLYFYYSALQEAQDIFGIDFDYDEFGKYGEDAFEEEDEDEYIHDEIENRPRPSKKHLKRKSTRKSIFEVYEPSELIRGHFTDVDNEVIIRINFNLSSVIIIKFNIIFI